MRVLVATDKFAGTMTGDEASSAIAGGWLEERPDDDVRVLPMADGGPGTVDVVAAATGAKPRSTATVNQNGRPVTARWVALPDGSALIEACSACGLDLVPPDQRRPLRATSDGVGLLLAAVADEGFRRIVVGLGGTGTVDGGLGLVRALGTAIRWRGDDIVSVGPVPGGPPTVVAAVDVTNPLLGDRGAARVFAPQKGASPDEVELLERRLTNLANVAESSLPGGPWRDRSGAGAGGGLGFGLMAWLGGEMISGATMVADLVGLAGHVDWADLVITGEGRIDTQTGAGKAPAHVAAMASEAGKPVAAVAGRVDEAMTTGLAAVEELGAEGMIRPSEAAFAAGRRLALRSHTYHPRHGGN